MTLRLEALRWFCLVFPFAVLAEWFWVRFRRLRRRPTEVLSEAFFLSTVAIFLLAVLPPAHLEPVVRRALQGALVFSIARGVGETVAARRRPVAPPAGPRQVLRGAGSLFGGVVLLVMLMYAVAVEAIDRYRTEPAWIQFPLRGRWAVDNGGRAWLFNGHNGIASQRYALDLSSLGPDGRGWRGSGRELAAHYAWNAPVYAPDEGIILEAEANLPDNPVGVQDRINARGNYVLLGRRDGTTVVLAHLKQGSLRVRPGDRVVAGQWLGQVGNSGNTSRPHLHLGVVRQENDREVGVAFGFSDVEPGFVRPRRGQILQRMTEAEGRR